MDILYVYIHLLLYSVLEYVYYVFSDLFSQPPVQKYGTVYRLHLSFAVFIV